MDGKKADPVSTDEVEEMDLGMLDKFPLWSRGESVVKSTRKKPYELAEQFVSLVEREVGKELDGGCREEVVTDISLILALWGRARKEEAAPALRKRVREFLEREDNIKQHLHELLEKVDEALSATDALYADSAPPEVSSD